ncbi:MAG: hypothetical protein ACREKN_02820 [Longimicrobiaceae bacterium]
MTAGADTVPPAPPPLGRRVWRTVVSPGAMFRELGSSAPWADALALVLLLGVLLALLSPAAPLIREAEAAAAAAGVELTSDPATIVRYGRYLNAMGSLAAVPLSAFGLAGVLYLLFSAGRESRPGYRQQLCVTAHALLIPALGAGLTLALGLLLEDPGFSFSPAWLAATPDGPLARLLAAVNPFWLWAAAVAGVGVGEMGGARSRTFAAGVLVALYLGFAAGLAALTG